MAEKHTFLFRTFANKNAGGNRVERLPPPHKRQQSEKHRRLWLTVSEVE